MALRAWPPMAGEIATGQNLAVRLYREVIDLSVCTRIP